MTTNTAGEVLAHGAMIPSTVRAAEPHATENREPETAIDQIAPEDVSAPRLDQQRAPPASSTDFTAIRLLSQNREDLLLEAEQSAHIHNAQSAFFEHTHHAQRAYYEEMQKARALHYERSKLRLACEQDVVAQLNANEAECKEQLAAARQELTVARQQLTAAQQEIMQLKEEKRALEAAAAETTASLNAAAADKAAALEAAAAETAAVLEAAGAEKAALLEAKAAALEAAALKAVSSRAGGSAQCGSSSK